MELYFKNVETERCEADAAQNFSGNEVADEQCDADENIAFAELAERVSAARLVY